MVAGWPGTALRAGPGRPREEPGLADGGKGELRREGAHRGPPRQCAVMLSESLTGAIYFPWHLRVPLAVRNCVVALPSQDLCSSVWMEACSASVCVCVCV